MSFAIGDTIRHKDHNIGMLYSIEDFKDPFYTLKYKTNGTVYDTHKDFVEKSMEKAHKYSVGDRVQNKGLDGIWWEIIGVEEKTYLLKTMEGQNIAATNASYVDNHMELHGVQGVKPLIKVEEKKKEEKEIPLDIEVGDWVTPINVSTGHTGTYQVVGTCRRNDTVTVNVETGPGSQLYLSNCRSVNQLQWKKVAAPEKLKEEEKKAHFFSVGDFIRPFGESETILEIIQLVPGEYYTKNNLGQIQNYLQSTIEGRFKLVQPSAINNKASSGEDFEKEYSKRVVSLAIKNNKVQKLIKKVDENRKELASLQNGEWFGLYGRYDWKRIGWTLFFVIASFVAPAYMAYLWGVLFLAATPLSLSVIAAIIYSMRDKKLDSYIKESSK